MLQMKVHQLATLSCILMCSSIFLSSCMSEMPDYTQQKPKSEGIVGTWVLTSESAGQMRGKGSYKSSNAEIVIDNNGVFHLHNIPHCAFNGDGPGWFDDDKSLVSLTGSWHLVQRRFNNFDDNEKYVNVWDLKLDYGNKARNLPSSPYPILLKQQPPYIIHFSFGDEDEGDCIEFTKRR